MDVASVNTDDLGVIGKTACEEFSFELSTILKSIANGMSAYSDNINKKLIKQNANSKIYGYDNVQLEYLSWVADEVDYIEVFAEPKRLTYIIETDNGIRKKFVEHL